MLQISSCLQNNAIADGKYASFVNAHADASDLHIVEAILSYQNTETIDRFVVYVGENTETVHDAILTLYVNGSPTNMKITIHPQTTGCLLSDGNDAITLTSDALVCFKASGTFSGIKLTAATLLLEE